MTATSLPVLILAAAVFLALAIYNSRKGPRRNTAEHAPDNGFLYAHIGTGDSGGGLIAAPPMPDAMMAAVEVTAAVVAVAAIKRPGTIRFQL